MPGSVLCVDDDRNLCRIIAKALGGEGYRVRTAFDGEAALAEVRSDPPDLVLLDVILPKRDGFGVLEELRRQRPGAPGSVVLLSGCSPTPETTKRAADLGASFLQKPVPLDDLLRVVAERVGTAATPQSVSAAAPAAPAARAVAASPAPRAEPERRRDGGGDLSGSLRSVAFPALLHHLHGMRATGVLRLERANKRKGIEFENGRPISIRSNLVTEFLGNLLVRQGRITQAALEASLSQMKGGKLQGEILVAMRHLSEDELTHALRAQAEEKLFEVFSWESGQFRFDRGATLERANALAVERSPANLIVQGVRQRFPLSRVDAYLRARAHLNPAPAESPFYRFQEIDLEPPLAAIVQGLDGTRPLSHLLGPDESLRRTLYGLLAAGLLEIESAGAGAAPQRPSPTPARAAAATPPPAGGAHRARLAALADRFETANHYEILGVAEDANESQIRNAYARLAEQIHPDRVSERGGPVRRLAEEVFGQVSEAYEVLCDPRQRTAYGIDLRQREREAADRATANAALRAELAFQDGEACMGRRDYTSALRSYGRALELYPDEGEYHAHYGWALHLCHPDDPAMTREAMEHVMRGLKLARSREKPYLFMGRLYGAVGKIDAAEKMYTRALQIRPDFLEAMRELRLINMRRERSRWPGARLLRMLRR